MLYVEPADERTALLELISEQKKPVVILLPAQSRLKVFQHPDEYSELKQVKRQFDLQIIFVISGNEHLRQLAGRNGFPAYVSLMHCRFFNKGTTGALTPAHPCQKNSAAQASYACR
jgi:hypothetical protein